MRLVLFMMAILGQLGLAVMASAQDSADRLVRLAVRAQLDGKHDQALDLYSEALTESRLPAHRRAALLADRAVIYARLARTKAALDDFNEAIRLYPERPTTYNNRGSVLLSIGHDREAVKDFNRAILLAPGYAAAYLNRGSALLQLGENVAGLVDYNRAVRLEPGDAIVLGARGVVHLRDGRWHAALRDFGAAVAVNDRMEMVYRQRALAHLKLGNMSQAVEDLSRAIINAPQDARLYVMRGRAYLQADDSEAATRDLSKAIEIKDGIGEAYGMRGLAYTLLEDYEAALSDLARALEIDQRSAQSYSYRAYAYLRMGQSALADRDLATARKLDDKSADLRWVEGEAAEVRGDAEKADALYRNVLADEPWHRLARRGLDRLGARPPHVAGVVIEGRGFDGWQMVQRGRRYFALNPEFSEIEIALETIGGELPRILDWEIRPSPHKRYGVLRFASGSVPAGASSTPLESAVVVDIPERKVMAILPHRDGERKARWTWSEQRLEVAAVDGVKDVIELEVRRSAPAIAHAGARRQRREGNDTTVGWVPWASPEEQSQRRRTATKARRQQQKSLFQMLFGN